ncbi:MAG: NAD(P)/FAD-dependent oxidoreductase [Sulfurimonadaceae bacterium]|jgi:predicted Rossmann fold flavoprotein|nr:NAD(P)/FAD-dependent oxidoreductase [Sulfurimonadaceae bacterium]
MIYDAITIGAGASGIIASISLARGGKKVLLLEKMPQIGLKVKASGGGKCNLTNKLSTEVFLEKFGKNRFFIKDAIENFNSDELIRFFDTLGVKTLSADGFRVFPSTHNSQTITDALRDELKKSAVVTKTSSAVIDVLKDDTLFKIITKDETFLSKNLILATGALGYKSLGTTGDGYSFAKNLSHTITPLYPAMLPLKLKEKWVANCKADTIAKATMSVDIKKYHKIKATGDLIFTNDGIRGPLVLDIAREITPLLELFGEVPITLNLTHLKNEDEALKKLQQNSSYSMLEQLEEFLPTSIAKEMLKILSIDESKTLKQLDGKSKDELIKLLVKTPLTVVGHSGYEKAMITRGGVSLKEVESKTLESKLTKGLYFCGEVLDIDGPCGGYNLQWAFSSGVLVAKSLIEANP